MNRPALALFAAAVFVAAACTSSEPPPAQPASEAAAPSSAPSAVPATDGSAETPPAVTTAKYYRPVKGIAAIEVIRGTSKRVGTDMVTEVKVKNVSTGRINLLKVDEYWYDKDLKQVSGTMESYRRPFNPGDIIEITLKSPLKPNLYRSTLMFSHANGKIDARDVKAFTEVQ